MASHQKFGSFITKWNFSYLALVENVCITKSCSSHLRILRQMYDKILKLWKIMLIHPLMIPGCITNSPITSTSAKTTFFKTRSISTNVTPNIHSGYQLRQDIWISEPIMWLVREYSCGKSKFKSLFELSLWITSILKKYTYLFLPFGQFSGLF